MPGMKASTLNDYKQRILRVLVHIQAHLDEALYLEELASLACFSPYHFHRVFRGMVGETLMDHVRRLRLERAAQRLKAGDAPVTRIAFEAGYETHEAFTRAFRTMFGASPSQYRESRHVAEYAESPCGLHFREGLSIHNFTPHELKGSTMEVRIAEIEPIRVAFVRHVGPYAACKQAWEVLCGWAGPRGLLQPETVYLGLSHDDPDVTPADKLRYDACIVVDREVRAEGEVGVQEIAGGDYAITSHRGPYEKLVHTYARLCGEWLPRSGREVRAAPSFEIYRNDPSTTRPEELLTDVHVPLQ